MFVHNITIQVDNSVVQQWLTWQREEYQPGMIAIDLFAEIKFFKLLELNEEETSTFILQCFIDSKEKHDRFLKQYSNAFKERLLTKWGERIIIFETLMESVN